MTSIRRKTPGRRVGSGRTSRSAGPETPPVPPAIVTARIGICLLAVFCAVLAAGEPTGYGVWDAILRGGLTATVTWLGGRADRLAVALLALLPISFLLGSIWVVPAIVGGLIAFGFLWFGMRGIEAYLRGASVLVPSTIAALGMQGILRMDADWFFGFESLLAAFAVVTVLVAGWIGSTERSRWLALRLVGGAGLLVLLVLVVVMTTLQSGRDAATDGVYAIERGTDAARVGELERAERLLNVADDSFSIAKAKLESVWLKPALLVPVVSQNIRAARVAVDAGSDLSGVAADVTRSLDFSALAGGGSGFDLTTFRKPGPLLEDAAASMSSARQMLAGVDDRWLLDGLSDGIRSADADLAEAQRYAELASSAVKVVPQLLGDAGPQRYFVIFATPSEARELGGFMGSWALIEADNGSVDLVRTGRWTELTSLASGAELDHPEDYPDFYRSIDPANFPANITSIPDIAEVGRAVVDLFPTFEGAPIDGVLYVDPFGLAALLEIVGPVTPSGSSDVLTPDNIANFLLRDQYARYEDVLERHAVLDDMVSQVFARLLTVELPPPGRLGEIFGPVGRGKRLQMVTFDAKANDFLREVDLLNDFPWPDENDFLSVTSINTAPNKLDAFLERDIRYEARLDADTGDLTANLRVTLSSEATTSLPSYILGPEREGLSPGDHRTQIVVWTPHQLNGAEVDGQPVPAGAGDAYGFRRYTVTVTVEPGQTREVLIGLAGQISVPEDYNLIMAHFPGAAVDDFEVRVVRSDGAGVEAEFPMMEDVFLSMSNPNAGVLPY